MYRGDILGGEGGNLYRFNSLFVSLWLEDVPNLAMDHVLSPLGRVWGGVGGGSFFSGPRHMNYPCALAPDQGIY